MAQDNDKGLYLPLKINLSEWEKSLTKADADLQKAMREMRSAVSDLKLQYDVKIAGAKAAGDQLKVAELEAQKLNQVLATQRTVVEALNRAYTQSVKEKGADAKATQALAEQLVRESKQLDRIQAQIDRHGLNLGVTLSNSLAKVSPEFAKIRELTSTVTHSMTEMGGKAIVAAKAIGGIGVAVAGIGAVVSGLDAITHKVNDIAEAGRQASDVVYQLRESAQTSYEDAEYIQRVTAIDGSSAESLLNSLVKLDATLLKDKDGSSEATLALKRYGAELVNTDGKVKSYKEQLQELSNAAQVAANAGEFGDFKAALPGAFRGTEFDHILLGLENYEKLAEVSSSKTKVLYDDLHKLSDWQNTLAETQRQYNAVKGGFFANSAVENLKNETDTIKAETILIDKNREALQQSANSVGKLTNQWTDFKGAVSVTLNEWLTNNSNVINSLIKIKDTWNDLEKRIFGGRPFDLWGDSLDNSTEQLNKIKKEIADARKQIENTKTTKVLQTPKDVVNPKEEAEKKKKAEDEEKKRIEAEEQFYRELRDLRASDYEKEINQLNDRKQQWIESGIAIVDAEARFSEEKEAIDKKYFDKQQAEREKALKQAQDAYNKEIEAAKKAREANISEAEATLRSNLKLARYIKREQEAGTYNEDNAREYANRLYMKQNNFRQSDIDFLKEFGVQNLKGIADARNRIFGDFANGGGNTTNNNSTVNINFDNTVVEDVNAMDRLANKVAEIITPAIQQALNGGTQYSY